MRGNRGSVTSPISSVVKHAEALKRRALDVIIGEELEWRRVINQLINHEGGCVRKAMRLAFKAARSPSTFLQYGTPLGGEEAAVSAAVVATLLSPWIWTLASR